MGLGTTPYKILFLLHLTAVIVGFGSSFVYPVLAVKARGLEPRESFAVNHVAYSISRYLTTYPIYAAGALGVILVLVSGEGGFKFSQQWVSIAFLLFFVALAIEIFLHTPNLKAMDELGARLVAGEGTPSKSGAPKEVAEMEERSSKAGMYGGILHLLFLLLMLDMVFKPGLLS